MKFLKNLSINFLLGIFLLGVTANLYAQDRASAVKAYNKARELAGEGKYEQSINMYNQARTIAEKLEEEGQDIVKLVQDKLPEIYLQSAYSRYKNFQKNQNMENLQGAIDQFVETTDIADKFSDQETAGKANQIVTKLMYQKSILQYKMQQFDASLATLDKIISRDPDYALAYFQKAIVIKQRDEEDLDQMLPLLDKAIEVGNQTNNSSVVRRATQKAAQELVYRGSLSIQDENYQVALDLLNRSLNYDDTNPNAYYRLSEAHNKLSNWDQALSFAQQALDYEQGGRTELAKIYFELGIAYQAKGNKDDACSSFENAAYGSFKSSAEHKMEYELKCESTTN